VKWSTRDLASHEIDASSSKTMPIFVGRQIITEEGCTLRRTGCTRVAVDTSNTHTQWLGIIFVETKHSVTLIQRLCGFQL
jgi:hypothetical protein